MDNKPNPTKAYSMQTC